MDFYNENEEDKKGAPVIPGSASPFKKSAFGRQPMFSRAAGSIMDRLKNLSRKDLAFVGIGLSVLVMAPVAEYMMSSSPSQDNLLKETFNPRSGPGGVTDPGINGLSTGSPDGSGEVITPLSSRDPMSLILGAQPAAALPPSAPPVNNFRDAMKESGRAAFSEAAKSAGAPTVIPRMQSALRGLSFSGEGGGTRTSGTLNGGKIIEDAKSASSKAKSRGMIGPVAMAGYKGVASNTPNSASKGAFEKLRSQADKSAGNFSGGSAMNSLDKAASDAANVSGAGGLGAGGDSEKTGRPSGSTTKYDHNRSGESLEEAAAKARQQKALEWEFFKKYEFKKQLLTAVFGAVSSSVGQWVGGTIGGILNPPSAPPKCWVPNVNLVYLPNGEHNTEADQANCKKGAVASSEYYLGAGDKATNAGHKEYCPCGRAAKPVITSPESGGAPSAADTTQVAQSAAAATTAMKDFDQILGIILTDTGNAVGNPKDKTVVVQAAKNVSGGFAELSNKRDAVIAPLAAAVRTADTANKGYDSTVAQYRALHAATNGKYETLSGQVAKVEAGLPANCEGSTVQMKDLGRGVSGSLDKAKCKDVKKWIEDWRNPAKDALKVVITNLDVHGKAVSEFQRQIGFVNTAIVEINTKYGQIYASYSKISPKQEEAIDVGPAVTRLNQMTAQLKDSLPEGTPAADEEATPMKLAASLRALNWDETWKAFKLTLDEEIKTKEGSKWADVQNAISSQGETKDDSARDFFSNSMRSNAITSSIGGRLPDFEKRIKVDLANIESGMETVKSKILSAGISPSYFDGAAPAVVPGGSNPPPVPVAVAGLSDASNTADTMSSEMGTQVADAEARYKEVVDSKKCTTLACSQSLSAANTDLKYMRDYKTEVKVLQEELKKPDINAGRVAQIKARLDDINSKTAISSPRSSPSLFDSNIKEAAKLAGVKSAVTPNPQPQPNHSLKPQTKPKKAATPDVIETVYLSQKGSSYGLSSKAGVEQFVITGGQKNSSGTNAYYSGRIPRGAHVFHVDVTCAYKAKPNTWEISRVSFQVEKGPVTQTSGVSGGVSVFGLSAGANASQGALTLQNGESTPYPGFAGKPCR